MKPRILSATTLAVLIAVTGCSSNPLSQNSGVAPGASATTPISEQTATNDFVRLGVTIKYGVFSGDVESIETVGYAPVWGNSQNALREAFRVAELEAKKSLNDFINKENVTSRTSVRMISKNLEQATDNKKNNFTTNAIRSDDNDVAADLEPQKNNGTTSKEDNTAVRNDALRIASTVNNTITTQNAGILAGLYLVKGEVINGGKNVRVVYRWDKKSNSVRPVVRGLMMQ